MSNSEPGCPYDSTPAMRTDVHERPRLIGLAAQDMLDHPEDSPAVASQLEASLKDMYGLMAESQPSKAESLIARGVRGATVAALHHVVQGRLNRKLLPVLERKGSLAGQGNHREGPPAEYAAAMLGKPLTVGLSADVFTREAYALGMEAVTGLRRDMSVGPRHPHRLLANAVTTAARRYRQARTGQVVGLSDESLDAEDDANGRIDSSYAALRLLLFGGLSAEYHEGSTSAVDLARYAARHLGALAMGAGTNRSAFDRVAPRGAMLLFDRHEAYHDQAGPLRRYATYFTSEGWAHPSLSRGAWPRPNCSGLLSLRSPDVSERADADALFAHAESRYGSALPRSEDGAYSQITALVGFIGLNVAEHTIYGNWQTIRPLSNA